MHNRPNPEDLLQRVRTEEAAEKRGRLKIYLGACPGVGKTYTMLTDALVQHAQGIDIVIGIIESHGRADIDKLAKNFTPLPPQFIEYRGHLFAEFNIDAALKRRPSIILIDEMAHTNAKGARHAKRWQDIREILDLGIDVYTTLNVQHIESLNDVVAEIVHSPIHETVPDFMLETAHTIELVDLPPEDLIKRLQEGKIYLPAQAKIAQESFFRKGNLIALRELALRITAEHVESEVLLYRQGSGIKHVWRTREKLLVCVTHHPESMRLIRTTKRMATQMNTEWMAVHCRTPRRQYLRDENNDVIRNLQLAERLGAQTRIISGFNIAEEIMGFARNNNITQIIVAKRIRPRWLEWFTRSLADELVRRSAEIDVYIITGDPGYKRSTANTLIPPKRFPWGQYAISFAIVSSITLFYILLGGNMGFTNAMMSFLLGISAVALYGTAGPTLFATLTSTVVLLIFFIPFPPQFDINTLTHLPALLIFITVSQLISFLVIRNRQQIELVRMAEKRTLILHSLNSKLASVRGVEKILDVSTHHLAQVFNSDVMILIAENNQLVIRGQHPAKQTLSEKELGIARWVFELGQIAGAGTETLAFADALFMPLTGTEERLGVLRIHSLTHGQLLTPEEMRFLEASTNQIALALEVDRLAEQRRMFDASTGG